jgi:2-polyprenyl-3-methyl-5-hydroxy-6-metoxy-1,4-benzoquinol methylase
MSCKICRKNNLTTIYDNLQKCSDCGFIFFDNTIPAQEIERLYKEDYFKGEEYLDYENDKGLIQKNFQRRIRDIQSYKSSGRLFEIGSAYGYFLDVAKNNYAVEGIDICKEPTEFARKKLNLNVHTGSYSDFLIKEPFDIFCMWDTIEHLPEPEKFIEKISRDLKSGGYLFLTTGDISSLLAKTRGKKWRMIHPPTHIFYFSQKTISMLLEKNGFEVISISHPGILRSFKQIFYSIFILNRKIKLPKLFLDLIEKIDFPVYLNTFDIMMVTARKK